MSQQRPAAAAYDAVVDGLLDLGVTFGAGLPDDWVSPVITRLEARDEVTFVRVAREPEAVAMCSGAFFAGVRSVAVMGGTGFLTCISEMVTLNVRHQIPLLMIVSMRGSRQDRQVFQEGQGRTLLPVANALGLPQLVVDSHEALAELPHAYDMCRIQKRPSVVWLTPNFIREPTNGEVG